MVSLYLVLGIGIDAVFVFSNTYALAEQDARGKHDDGRGGHDSGHGGDGGGGASGATRRAASEAAVLVHAVRQSVGVTGLSTMTTAVAFGASIASPITTIRQFAMFQTSVVVIDYVMILFIFVPFMVFWRRHVFRTLAAAPKAPSPPTSAAGRARRCAWSVLRVLLLPLRLLFAPARPAFWARAAPLLYRARYACLVGWAGLLATQTHYASRIEASSSAPSVFDADHNLSRYVFLRRYRALREAAPSHRVAAPIT